MYALDRICFDARFRFSLRAMREFAEEPGAFVRIAEQDGSLLGFVVAQPEPEGVYLVTLDVAPEHRRQGIAGTLVAQVEAFAADLGEAVLLHVFTENLPAIGFYERRGYVRLGLIAHFYGHGLDAFVYRNGCPMIDEA